VIYSSPASTGYCCALLRVRKRCYLTLENCVTLTVASSHIDAIGNDPDSWEMFTALRFDLKLVVDGRIVEVNCGHKQGVWE
jgi:hypothetical protein